MLVSGCNRQSITQVSSQDHRRRSHERGCSFLLAIAKTARKKKGRKGEEEIPPTLVVDSGLEQVPLKI